MDRRAEDFSIFRLHAGPRIQNDDRAAAAAWAGRFRPGQSQQQQEEDEQLQQQGKRVAQAAEKLAVGLTLQNFLPEHQGGHLHFAPPRPPQVERDNHGREQPEEKRGGKKKVHGGRCGLSVEG